MNAHEVYRSEVERHIDKKVKIIMLDRGEEYYERYNETGQCLGLFTKFLKKRGICAQYTMLSTPQPNGAVER